MRNNIAWYKKMVAEELKNSLTYRIRIETLYNAYTDTFIIFLIDERTDDTFKSTIDNFTEELWAGLDLQTIVRVTTARYKAYIQQLYFK